jgi:hypothetical protein
MFLGLGTAGEREFRQHSAGLRNAHGRRRRSLPWRAACHRALRECGDQRFRCLPCPPAGTNGVKCAIGMRNTYAPDTSCEIALHAHGTTRRQVLLRAERITVVDLNAAMSVEEAAIAAKYSIAVGGRMPVWCAHLARRINTRRRVWAQSLWRLPGIHVPCTRGGRGVAEMTFLDIRFDGNLTFFAITLWHGFDGRALCFLTWACWEGNLTRTLPAPNSEREE